MTRSRTPDVETLACAAAGEYAARWARGVASASSGVDGDGSVWLVDAFAGADLQRAAIRGTKVDPPAVAMICAADAALAEGAHVVLVEEDPGLLARVEDALQAADLGDRIRRASSPAAAEPGAIVLVERGFSAVAASLAEQIGGDAALLRLAPLDAKALPWGALEPLAALPAADVLLRFPQEDFLRQGRFAGPLADFPPHLRRVVEACSALFADPRHGWLLAWRDAARAGGLDAALSAAVERLAEQIAGVYGDVERLARAVRVEGEGGAVHLLLTTSDPDHALELDAAVTEAGAPPPPAPKRAKSAAPAKSAAAAPPPVATSPSVEAAPPPPADVEASPAAPSAPSPDAEVQPEPKAEPQPAPSDASEVEPQPESIPEPVSAEPADPTRASDAAPVVEPAPEPPAESTTLLDLFVGDPLAALQPASKPSGATRKPKARKEKPELLGLFDEPEPADADSSTETEPEVSAGDSGPGLEIEQNSPTVPHSEDAAPAKKPRRRKGSE